MAYTKKIDGNLFVSKGITSNGFVSINDSSLNIDTGNIGIMDGDIGITNGDINVTNGSIGITGGDLTINSTSQNTSYTITLKLITPTTSTITEAGLYLVEYRSNTTYVYTFILSIPDLTSNTALCFSGYVVADSVTYYAYYRAFNDNKIFIGILGSSTVATPTRIIQLLKY